jgi:hypothetical protein
MHKDLKQQKQIHQSARKKFQDSCPHTFIILLTTLGKQSLSILCKKTLPDMQDLKMSYPNRRILTDWAITTIAQRKGQHATHVKACWTIHLQCLHGNPENK